MGQKDRCGEDCFAYLRRIAIETATLPILNELINDSKILPDWPAQSKSEFLTALIQDVLAALVDSGQSITVDTIHKQVQTAIRDTFAMGETQAAGQLQFVNVRHLSMPYLARVVAAQCLSNLALESH